MAYSIVISLAKRRLSLMEGQKAVKTYPVGIGTPMTATPTGLFRIISKANNPGGPYGARWLGLSKPHYGIHGTNNPQSIGKLVSKGCIRMYNQDIIDLADKVAIGTKVTIKQT